MPVLGKRSGHPAGRVGRKKKMICFFHVQIIFFFAYPKIWPGSFSFSLGGKPLSKASTSASST